MRERPVPALGRVSQAKRFYRLLLKPALFQIIQNVPALCKFRFVKLHGFFQQEKISPALEARSSKASGKSTPSISFIKAKISPPLEHPKQCQISRAGET